MLSIVKQMIRNNTSFYIFLIGALLMLSCTHSNRFRYDFISQKLIPEGTFKRIRIISIDGKDNIIKNNCYDSLYIYVRGLRPNMIYVISNNGGDRKGYTSCFETNSEGKIYKELDVSIIPDSLKEWAIY